MAHDDDRLRIAAGLLGEPEAEARAIARAMSPAERKTLAGQIEWVLEYELEERRQKESQA